MKEASDKLSAKDLGLSGRDLEVWKPALTMASMLGGEVWENVLKFAEESRAAIAEESYEELKEVLEGIYEIIREKSGEFPVKFTPKQIHDRIWEKLKADYRVTKEKQEVQGEVSEKYDYDTRRFETAYSSQRIGQTYLQQLGLRRKHTKTGTVYTIADGKTFHAMVTRYHPSFPKEAEDYDKLILTEKLPTKPTEPAEPADEEANPHTPKKPSPLSPPSPDPDLNREKGPPVVTAQETGDSQGVTGKEEVSPLEAETTHRNGAGDTCDGCDGFSEVSPRKGEPKP